MNSNAYSDALLAAAMEKITASQNRVNDLRSRNRTITIIFVGAILGYSLEKADGIVAVLLPIAAILVVLAQYWQEHILHRYQHGWQALDERTRKYISGTLIEDNFRLLDYHKQDERKAWFSSTSGWIFVLLFLGSFGTLLINWLAR